MQNLCLSSQKFVHRDLFTLFFSCFKVAPRKNRTNKTGMLPTYVLVLHFMGPANCLIIYLSLSPTPNPNSTNDNCDSSSDSSISRTRGYSLVTPPRSRRATGPTSARSRRRVSPPQPNAPAESQRTHRARHATPSTNSTSNSVCGGSESFYCRCKGRRRRRSSVQ